MSDERQPWEKFGELFGRVTALEQRLDRHENMTQTALRDMRVEMSKTIGDLKTEMKGLFAEMKVNMSQVASSISDLREANDQQRGIHSALSWIGAAALTIASAVIGGVVTIFGSSHR